MNTPHLPGKYRPGTGPAWTNITIPTRTCYRCGFNTPETRHMQTAADGRWECISYGACARRRQANGEPRVDADDPRWEFYEASLIELEYPPDRVHAMMAERGTPGRNEDFTGWLAESVHYRDGDPTLPDWDAYWLAHPGLACPVDTADHPALQAERDRLMPQACDECGGEVPRDGAEPDHLDSCSLFPGTGGPGRRVELTLTVTVPLGCPDQLVLNAVNRALDERPGGASWGVWEVGEATLAPRFPMRRRPAGQLRARLLTEAERHEAVAEFFKMMAADERELVRPARPAVRLADRATAMTGPEHYAAGDALMAEYAGRARDKRPYAPGLLAEAQAHYTAALAAATAMAHHNQGGDSGMPLRDRRAWFAAAGTTADPANWPGE